jgi:hypothetical protein
MGEELAVAIGKSLHSPCIKLKLNFNNHEDYSGYLVLACCVMRNHFQILLEARPKSKAPLTDEQRLKRLGGLYPKAFVATVTKDFGDARAVVAQGLVEDPAESRRSSHGEAIGATGKSEEKAKAKADLVGSITSDKGTSHRVRDSRD